MFSETQNGFLSPKRSFKCDMNSVMDCGGTSVLRVCNCGSGCIILQ